MWESFPRFCLSWKFAINIACTMSIQDVSKTKNSSSWVIVLKSELFDPRGPISYWKSREEEVEVVAQTAIQGPRRRSFSEWFFFAPCMWYLFTIEQNIDYCYLLVLFSLTTQSSFIVTISFLMDYSWLVCSQEAWIQAYGVPYWLY